MTDPPDGPQPSLATSARPVNRAGQAPQAPPPEPTNEQKEPNVDNWEIAARERIRDTMAAYTHSGDRGQIDLLAETFTEDGVLEIDGREPAVGRAAIIAMLSSVVAQGASLRSDRPPLYVRHFVTNLRFDEITPREARTSAYFLVMTDRGPDHWGRYRDRLVPVGDRWLFSRRFVRIDDGGQRAAP